MYANTRTRLAAYVAFGAALSVPSQLLSKEVDLDLVQGTAFKRKAQSPPWPLSRGRRRSQSDCSAKPLLSTASCWAYEEPSCLI
jgi:hypothetical protein